MWVPCMQADMSSAEMHAVIAVCLTLEALMMILVEGSGQLPVADVALPGGLLVYSLPHTDYRLFQLSSQRLAL